MFFHVAAKRGLKWLNCGSRKRELPKPTEITANKTFEMFNIGDNCRYKTFFEITADKTFEMFTIRQITST